MRGIDSQVCASNETITVAVRVLADGQLYTNFSTACYGKTIFVGQTSGKTLSGQLRLNQKTCVGNDGECRITVTGQASGSFDTTRIHLETPSLRTSRYDFGSNVIDVYR